MASNETPKYKLSVVEGTELQLSLLGPTGPAGISGTITTSTSTNLTGYIYGNGTNIAGATAATFEGTPNTLVLRNEYGAARFQSNETVGRALEAYTTGTADNANPYAVYGHSSGAGGRGGYFYGESDYGARIESNSGEGAVISSLSNVGASIYSANGTHHARFGIFGDNRSAIERIRGWFVWFFGNFVGRLKTADITANREWTLPNATGTIALIDSSQTFSQSQTFSGAFEATNNVVKLTAIPTFENNSAASSLATGSVYKTSTGELRIKY